VEVIDTYVYKDRPAFTDGVNSTPYPQTCSLIYDLKSSLQSRQQKPPLHSTINCFTVPTMHFIRALLGFALAAFVAAAPPPSLAARDDPPQGCPNWCHCSQYTDFQEYGSPEEEAKDNDKKRERRLT
jgi:hypothetical protein